MQLKLDHIHSTILQKKLYKKMIDASQRMLLTINSQGGAEAKDGGRGMNPVMKRDI
jgi:ATP-dependent protease ClpP protease subunit